MFVGADRLRAVTTLTQSWDTAVNSGDLGVVVVRGPSGSGRTTMLQLLYRHCAMWGPRPRYWPADLVDHRAGVSEAAADEVSPDKELLYPRLLIPDKDSRLGVFWWGLRGQHDAFAVSEGELQIKAHINGLADAVSRADELTRDRLLVALDTVCLLGSLVPPLGAPLAAAAQYGLNWVAAPRSAPSLAKRLVEVSRNKSTHIDQAQRGNAGRVLTVGGRGAAVENAEHDGRALALVAGVVPFTIVVDDAQLLDDVTLNLLKVIAGQGSSRGLIVLAVNTDMGEVAMPDATGKALSAWLDELQRTSRLTSINLLPMTRRELLDVAAIKLGALPDSEIGAQALATVIAASRGSPGRLAFMLRVSSIQAAITNGDQLPWDWKTYTEQTEAEAAFEKLTTESKAILATAAIHGPLTYASWLTSAPGGDADGRTAMTSAQLDAALATGWLQQGDDGSVRFFSGLLYRVARKHLTAEVTPPRIHRAWQSLAAWVAADHQSEAWVQVPTFVAESVLTALTSHRPNGVGDPDPAWTAELLRLRRVTGRQAADEATLSALEERLRTGSPSALLVVATAEALFDAGHTQRALDVLHDELYRVTVSYGDGHPTTFPALQNLAIGWAALAHYHSGQPEASAMFQQAISRYRQLLAGREQHHKPDDRRISDTRWALAKLLADHYQYREAIDEGQHAVQEMRRCTDYGPDHPDTLVTRGNLAGWTGEAGDAAGARDLFAALLPDLVRVLGPDHRGTLATRNNLAMWTGQAGGAAGARGLFAALLPDQIRVLGPDHPNTLATRGNLAGWTGEAGDAAGARDLFAALLPDLVRVLGPDHPNTLATRNNLAGRTRQAEESAK